MMINPLLDKITNRLNENLHAILPKKKKYYLKTSALCLAVAVIGALGILSSRSDSIIVDMFFAMCFYAGSLTFGYHVEQLIIHRKKYKKLCRNDAEFFHSIHGYEILSPSEVSELLSYQLPDYAAKIIYDRIAGGGQITYSDTVEINRLLSIDNSIHEKNKTTRIAAIENNFETFFRKHHLDNKQCDALSNIIQQHIPVQKNKQHTKTFNSRKVL